MKKLLQSRGATGEQAEMVLKIVEKDPSLFQQIAREIDAKVKQGQDQQQAALEVMMAHQEELKKLTQ